MKSHNASKLSHHDRRTKDIVCFQKAFIIQVVVPVIKRQNDAGVQNGCSSYLVYQTTQAVVVAAKTRTRPDEMTLAPRVVR